MQSDVFCIQALQDPVHDNIFKRNSMHHSIHIGTDTCLLMLTMALWLLDHVVSVHSLLCTGCFCNVHIGSQPPAEACRQC